MTTQIIAGLILLSSFAAQAEMVKVMVLSQSCSTPPYNVNLKAPGMVPREGLFLADRSWLNEDSANNRYFIYRKIDNSFGPELPCPLGDTLSQYVKIVP